MLLKDVVILLENKLCTLNNLKTNFTVLGDLEQISIVEKEIAETEATLTTLRNLA